MDTNFDSFTSKTMNTSMELDKLKIIDSKKEWKKSWVSGGIRSTYFIEMLESCGFKFSDFLIIDLYTSILFNHIGRESTKNMIDGLRCIITITKKEEEDLIRNGFKGNKNEKKIYKRLIKSYFTKINEKKGLVIRGLKHSEMTGKDCLIIMLDSMLSMNVNEEKVIDELGNTSECGSSYFFMYYYLVSIYMDYKSALRVVEVYGEILSGEFKHKVQQSLVSRLSKFLVNATNKNLGLSRGVDDIGFNLALDLVESENMQLQDEKTFYSKRYLEAVNKIGSLEKTIEELKEELEFFKNIYKNKLRNKRILLIGDKKKVFEYEDVINSLGGEMDMYDSFDDFSKITSATLDGFDYIIHFTYYTNHSVSNKLSKYSRNVFFVNSSSKMELEKVLISI